MSLFKDLTGFLIMMGGDELREGASLLGKTAVSTAECAGIDLVSKIDEKLDEHNKKAYEKNKNKQVGKLRVLMWFNNNIDLFPKSSRKSLQEMLEKTTNEQFMHVSNISFKKPVTMFFISLFLGIFGVDRFILRDIKMGIIKLMTCGGMFIWWFIDLFTINNRTRDYNLNKVNSILNKGGINDKHE